MHTIRELIKPCADKQFLSILHDYELELHDLDSAYPVGRTISYLDIDGFRTFIAEDKNRFIGFITLESKDAKCEIHEFYVIPERRNLTLAKELLNIAISFRLGIVFNVFKKNIRVLKLAEHIFAKNFNRISISEITIWDVDCLHFETI